jgi:hypothetical protein
MKTNSKLATATESLVAMAMQRFLFASVGVFFLLKLFLDYNDLSRWQRRSAVVLIMLFKQTLPIVGGTLPVVDAHIEKGHVAATFWDSEFRQLLTTGWAIWKDSLVRT